MAQRQPHVPKFSDFESADDFPYTPYSQRPRQNKATALKNKPNDPEKNVETFMQARKGKTRENESFPPISPPNENSASIEKRLKNHRKKNSRSTDSGSEKSVPDNFANKNRGKDNRKKNVVESEYFVPPSTEHRSTSVLCDASSDSKVPKYGAWDEKDSTSGDVFNLLFDKVKEEKKIAASKFPVTPSRVVTHTVA